MKTGDCNLIIFKYEGNRLQSQSEEKARNIIPVSPCWKILDGKNWSIKRDISYNEELSKEDHMVW